MSILRRIRGAAGTAITWGVAFSALATALFGGALALGVLPDGFNNTMIPEVALRGFLAGAVAGSLFATLLASGTERRTISTLSLRRVATWGFIGAAAVPMVFATALGLGGVLPLSVMAAGTLAYGVLGSLIAVGTVKLARRSVLPASAHAALPGDTNAFLVGTRSRERDEV